MIQVVTDGALFERVIRESLLAETAGTLRLVTKEVGDEVLVAFKTHRGVAKIVTTRTALRSALAVLDGGSNPPLDEAPATMEFDVETGSEEGSEG